MSQENPGTYQAQNRCNRLNHGNRPFYPGSDRTTALLHSQKDFVHDAKIAIRLMIWRNSQVTENEKRCCKDRAVSRRSTGWQRNH